MSIPLTTVVLCLFLLAITGNAIADSSEGQTDTANSTITKSAVVQSEPLESQAARWSLKAIEYQRYLDLMNGPLGKWNPTIDPLLALGMFATNAQEEQRYAELYAQQEFELTRRTLRFQQAYRAAFEHLYPNTTILDQRLLMPYYSHQQQKDIARQAQRDARRQFKDGDRLLVFVSPNCSNCQTLISRLMGLVSAVSNSGVDIYVRNAQNDAAVRRWAQAHHIQEAWLEGQRLSLNRDEGLYQRLQSRSTQTGQEGTPIFLKRDGRFFQLNARRLGL